MEAKICFKVGLFAQSYVIFLYVMLIEFQALSQDAVPVTNIFIHPDRMLQIVRDCYNPFYMPVIKK